MGVTRCHALHSYVFSKTFCVTLWSNFSESDTCRGLLEHDPEKKVTARGGWCQPNEIEDSIDNQLQVTYTRSFFSQQRPESVMAHQAHSIPWNLLAANFQYRFAEISYKGVTNLYPRFEASQGKELNHFVLAFNKAIEEHIESEASKYPQYEPPGPEEVVLSDEVVKKVSPTVHRVRHSYRPWLKTRRVDDYHKPNKPCRDHNDNSPEKCTCPLPLEDRKMKAFLHRWKANQCYYFWEENEAAFLGLETFKSLLLYGETDLLLRICSHPNVDYAKCWRQAECYDTGFTLGWDLICTNALSSYICLNVLYCYPELWDRSSGRSAEKDYRRTGCYQRMLRQCTERVVKSDLSCLPHRQFYGITDDQFVKDFERSCPYGILPIEKFLELDNVVGYQPSGSDVEEVQLILCGKGIPMEIVLDIMGLAKYTHQRRLVIPHDPLHPENWNELRKYLTYCWTLMVRCGVVAKGLGTFINWKRIVPICMVDLLGVFREYSFTESRRNMIEYVWAEDEPGIDEYDSYVPRFL